MQLTTTPAPATSTPLTRPIAPGTVLGNGIVRVITTGGIQFPIEKRVDITAGETIMSGIRDVRTAAQQLIRRTWEDPAAGIGGLVGFVRNGDTFDAVELLAPRFTDGSSRVQVWAPWNIADFQPVDDLVAAWQISPYGGDAHLREPGSMFPAEPIEPPTKH